MTQKVRVNDKEKVCRMGESKVILQRTTYNIIKNLYSIKMTINVKSLDSILKEVELRSIWPKESQDFSKWLSEEVNLQQLSNVLDLDLKHCDNEVVTGRFRTDILAKDLDSDNFVIIENQLEKSDHRHLGQCLTYMSYHEAKYCIWICKNLQEEHRRALIKLNETTEPDYRFYAVEIKTYEINKDNVYKFNVVVKPDFIEKYRKSIKENKNPRILQLNNFWEKVKQQLPVDLRDNFRIQYSGKQYANLTFNQKPFWIFISFSVREKKVRVGIVTNLVETYNKLKSLIDEKSFGNSSKLNLKHVIGVKNSDWNSFVDEKDYINNPDENIEWMAETAKKMYNYFKNISI